MALGRRTIGVVAAAAVIAAVLALVVSSRNRATASAHTTVQTTGCPWLSESEPIATRVDELLKAMTRVEEASLLHLHQVGAGVPYEGYTQAIPRLCIPMITEQDGAEGVATGFQGVTQLPAPIADGAAFDTSLARAYGGVIGSEDSRKGVDLALSPTINIDRSPLWGRSYETLGEDPYLSAQLAAPLIEGIQAHRVVSVVKHYAVYNQEEHRGSMLDDSVVSDRALHEIYLPAFASAIESADAGSVMCSYNLVNGIPACENAELINQILEKDWHFTGFVRSDCGSVYHEQAAIAVGLSQVKCSKLYQPALMALLPKATLDTLARPLLTVLFEYDLIANPHAQRYGVVATTAADRNVALTTANEGAVLLKNDGLLPLNLSAIPSLALIGADGGTPMPTGFGAARVLPTQPVTAYSALHALLGDRLRYVDGSNLADAVAIAKHATAAVVVVHDYEIEGEDRTSLALPGLQDQLVAAVAAANPHTIVVLETGGAVLMPWLKSVAGVLETWYPGEVAGTSLAELLGGQVDPSGKLPVTFPASESARPDNTAETFGGVQGETLYSDGVDVGYRWYQAHDVTPLFPFGYGLSYTRFQFSQLDITATSVSAVITNTGPDEGSDVVQWYAGDPASLGEAPRQLRGFTRVDLLPRHAVKVTFPFGLADFATWDSATQQFVTTAGTYQLWVGDGSDSGNLPLSGSIAVPSSTLGPAASPGLS